MTEIIKSEKQFAEWFKKNYRKFGYEKILRKDIRECPDFIMLKSGKKCGVELEIFSSNFLLHKHNLDSVDEILCLIKDIELGKPIKIIKDLIYQGPKRITLSIDAQLYDKFKKYCYGNAIDSSRKIEIWIEEFMKGEKN